MNTVTIPQALEALDSLDDYSKMDTSVDPVGSRETIKNFILQSAVYQRQIDKLKLKNDFETMMFICFPDAEWNFRWDTKKQDYISTDMAWRFFCYIKGRFHKD